MYSKVQQVECGWGKSLTVKKMYNLGIKRPHIRIYAAFYHFIAMPISKTIKQKREKCKMHECPFVH